MAATIPANTSSASSATISTATTPAATATATTKSAKKRSASKSPDPSKSLDRPKKKHLLKKCCFHDPGGPWPKNTMMQALCKPDLAAQFITLLVGPESDPTVFCWFSDVLGFHSRFFSAAMDDTWVESEKRTIKMPDDDAKVVEVFMRWISDHRIGGYGKGSDNPSLTPLGYYELMVDTWIFAEKYGIPRLQNVAVNEIITLFVNNSTFPNADIVEKIYDSTPKGSKLYQLLIDMMPVAHDALSDLIRDQVALGKTFPSAFLMDLLLRKPASDKTPEGKGSKKKPTDRKEWTKVGRCQYHVFEIRDEWKGQKVLRPSAE